MLRNINGGRSPPGRKRECRPAGNRTASLKTTSRNGNAYNRSAGEPQASEIRRLRRQHQIERICQIPRIAFELIDELDRYHNLGEDLDRRLERYASLDVEILRALGADRFPPRPLRIIGSAQ